jgi:hypothetical protein
MYVSGIDPQTKKFTEPPEIAALKADKSARFTIPSRGWSVVVRGPWTIFNRPARA